MSGPGQAVILLAGAGSRLGVYTERIPKCMVEVAGAPLLPRLLAQLENLGVSEAILVVGYKAEVIKAAVGESHGQLAITYVTNEEWETTNNVVSLNLVVDSLKGDFFLLEGDLFFAEGMLDRLAGRNAMAVDRYRRGMDGTVVTVSYTGQVKRFYLKETPGRPPDESLIFKTVNAYSLARDSFITAVAPRLDRLISRGESHVYYERAFAEAVEADELRFEAVRFSEGEWCEIDTADDLQRARNRFGD